MAHPSIDPSQASRPTAAGALRASKEEVVHAWEQHARRRLPAAAGKPHHVLTDSLPEFLEEMISSLEHERPRLAASREVGYNHALQRSALTDFDLEQILGEYYLLQQVVFETLDRQIELSAHERNIILEMIHYGKAAAAKNFSELVAQKDSLMQANLRVARERLGLAIDAAKMGIWDWDIRTGTLEWSGFFVEGDEASHQKTPRSIEDLWNRVHQEDLPHVRDVLNRALSQKKPFEVEFRLTPPEGNTHWISAHGRVLSDESGAAVKITGTAVDVTARKLLEQDRERLHLAESETRRKLSIAYNELNSLLESSPVGIAFLDPDLRFVRVNSTLAAWHGISPEAHIGKSFRELIPEQGALLENELREVLLSGKPVLNRQFTVNLPNSPKPRHEIYSQFPIRGPEGDVIGVGGLIVDVTDRIEASHELEHSEMSRPPLFDNAPVGIAEVDPATGRFSRVNPKYCEMLGYSSEELSQLHLRDVTHPDDETQEAGPGNEPFQEETNGVRKERRYCRKNGSLIWTESSTTTLRGSDGRAEAVIVVSLDMTKRKEFETQMLKALQQLREERVIRERFVSTLSHDLRTPLQTARMNTQLAIRKAEQRDRVIALSSKSVDAIDRADRMIQDLLDVSRIKAGQKLTIHPEKFDLVKLLHEVRDDLVASYGADFRLNAPARLIGYWSRSDLRRVIENLGSNAAKYGDNTRPIQIQVRPIDGEVELSVHNYGPAIPGTELPNLFDSFLRSSTSQNRPKGWGLGLSLVRGVVEAHSGQVRVESQEKRGTTFTIRLPLDSRTVNP